MSAVNLPIELISKVFVQDYSEESKQVQTCPICLSDFVANEILYGHGEHFSHKACLKQWLITPGDNTSCPQCRAKFLPLPSAEEPQQRAFDDNIYARVILSYLREPPNRSRLRYFPEYRVPPSFRQLYLTRVQEERRLASERGREHSLRVDAEINARNNAITSLGVKIIFGIGVGVASMYNLYTYFYPTSQK